MSLLLPVVITNRVRLLHHICVVPAVVVRIAGGDNFCGNHRRQKGVFGGGPGGGQGVAADGGGRPGGGGSVVQHNCIRYSFPRIFSIKLTFHFSFIETDLILTVDKLTHAFVHWINK